MKRARVFRLSMAHPADLSELENLIANGTIAASEVVAIAERVLSEAIEK